MNLTRQPPRRASNLSIAGIVGAARMTDKAKAYHDEVLGDYLYGDDSGLDRKVLGLLGITADAFAEAADEYDDETLGKWMLEQSGITQSEIDKFNQTELSIEPQTEEYRQRLKDRLAKYAPDRTDVKTVLQSVELDDWGIFWPVDLTKRPPRSPHCKDVAGIFGIARMVDKARAARAEKLDEYRYGESSGHDLRVLGFLGVSAEEFQEAAVNNPNDLELGASVLEKSGKTPEEIAGFNRTAPNAGLETEEAKARFHQRCQEVDPTRTDIMSWADLMDVDDELSFGIVDLARHAPRSPYDASARGMVSLARAIDKARALNGNTLGEYWYGEDSGHDRFLLAFLGLSPQEFADGVKTNPTDEDIVNWLKKRGPKTEAEIADFNEKAVAQGPANDAQRVFIARVISRLDPSRTDIQTFFNLMVLSDQKSFE